MNSINIIEAAEEVNKFGEAALYFHEKTGVYHARKTGLWTRFQLWIEGYTLLSKTETLTKVSDAAIELFKTAQEADEIAAYKHMYDKFAENTDNKTSNLYWRIFQRSNREELKKNIDFVDQAYVNRIVQIFTTIAPENQDGISSNLESDSDDGEIDAELPNFDLDAHMDYLSKYIRGSENSNVSPPVSAPARLEIGHEYTFDEYKSYILKNPEKGRFISEEEIEELRNCPYYEDQIHILIRENQTASQNKRRH